MNGYATSLSFIIIGTPLPYFPRRRATIFRLAHSRCCQLMFFRVLAPFNRQLRQAQLKVILWWTGPLLSTFQFKLQSTKKTHPWQAQTSNPTILPQMSSWDRTRQRFRLDSIRSRRIACQRSFQAQTLKTAGFWPVRQSMRPSTSNSIWSHCQRRRKCRPSREGLPFKALDLSKPLLFLVSRVKKKSKADTREFEHYNVRRCCTTTSITPTGATLCPRFTLIALVPTAVFKAPHPPPRLYQGKRRRRHLSLVQCRRYSRVIRRRQDHKIQEK